MKKGYERVLGRTYKIGTKAHKIAKEQVKQFNDLESYEVTV